VVVFIANKGERGFGIKVAGKLDVVLGRVIYDKKKGKEIGE